jgi:hypothetical protein
MFDSLQLDRTYTGLQTLGSETVSFKRYGEFRVRIMVFSTTFNNILAILWLSILLMEESGVPSENHRPAASH